MKLRFLPVTIAARLAVAVLAAGIAGGLIGAFVLRGEVRDSLQLEIERTNRGVAERRASELDGAVDDLVEQLRLIGANAAVLDPVTAPDELAVALRATAEFSELTLYDLAGRPVATAAERRLSDASELAPRPELAASVEAGSSVAVLPGDPTLLEARVAVENPPGIVSGTLVGVLPFSAAVGPLRAAYLGDTAEVFAVDGEGAILVHPDRRRVSVGETYPADRILEAAGRAAVLDGPEGKVLAAAATAVRVPVTVIVEQRESEAFAQVSEEARDRTLVVVALVGFLSLLAVALGTLMLRPLRDLARAVRRIGEGETDVRVPEKGTLEIQTVAREVNRMVDALEDRHERLREVEERFRTAFREAPVAMAMTTPEGVYEAVNPAMTVLLERTEGDLLGRNWRDLTHPDDLDVSEAAATQARVEGRPSYQVEKRYLRPDGSVVWVLLSVAFAGGPEHPDRYIAHFIDLTQRRQAEERLRRVLEEAPDAVLVVTGDGTIEFVNRRVGSMFGYEPAALIGQPVEILAPEPVRDRHVGHRRHFEQEPVARAMGEGLELAGRRRDGAEFPVEISLSPLETEDGLRIIATVRDITDRKQAQETARALQELRGRQRQAMEINDNVVQGLTIAKWSFELDQVESARLAVEQTLDAAQELVDRMLREGSPHGVQPGDLVREHPAEFGR